MRAKEEEKWEEKGTDLNAGGIELQYADPGANFAQNPQLHTIVQRRVSDQIGGVCLKEIHSIDGDHCLHFSLAVRLLVKSRHYCFS